MVSKVSAVSSVVSYRMDDFIGGFNSISGFKGIDDFNGGFYKGDKNVDRAKKTDIIIVIVLLAALALPAIRYLGFMPGGHSTKAESASPNASGTVSENTSGEAANASGTSGGSTGSALTYQDYNGKNIGILTGTNMEQATFEYFPDSEYFYFDGYPNMITALENSVIDAFLGDEPALKSIHASQPQIDYIKERLTNNQYSFAFRKDDPEELALRNQFNEFLQGIKDDGTYQEIDSTWFGADESKKVVDYSGLTGENGTIHVVTTSTDEPFSYIKDGKHVGYDIDVAVRFCRVCGYAIEIGDVDFQARIPALASGQYEFTTTMNVTPEREESVLFSDPVSEGGIVVAVRSEDLKQAEGADASGGTNASEGADASEITAPRNIFVRIAESFKKNFIRENRWKLILQGLGTTCLITALSILFGTVLGFAVCLLRHTGSRLGNALCDIFVRVLQGTPTVVLLMILYYVILGRTGINAIWVAVIGFSLNFGAYSSEIMNSGYKSVDPGQREAALSLGFSERDALLSFVLPQAALKVLPVYRGEMISLLKSTSVVGYIAIRDLTKMSDIIRSRTYEAFFPLIATALIYFALSWLISEAVRLAIRKMEPKQELDSYTGREY